ncbi:MAG: hypothetical protein U0800_19605 [Isosphaeraceae bacterium]
MDKPPRSRRRRRYRPAALLLCLLAGCALGPRQIDVGHLRYNEAIKDSFTRELLLNLVRLKYRESPEFVEIGGVAAQYSFESSVNASGKFFDFIDSFQGVSIGGSLNRAERPTITYAPLRGKDFEARLITPVSGHTIGLLANKGWRVDRVLRVSARSLNQLENAPTAGGPTPSARPEFEAFLQATTLLRQLQNCRGIEFVSADSEQRTVVPMPVEKVDGPFLLAALDKGYKFEREGESLVLVRPKKEYVLAIHPAAVGSPAVAELSALLHLDPGRDFYPFNAGETGRILASFDRKVRRASQESAPAASLPAPLPPDPNALPAPPATILPPEFAYHVRSDIGIQSRSLIEMMYYLAQNVEVPESHVRQGLVTITRDAQGLPFDWNEMLGDLFRIRVSKAPPHRAYASVKYRGYWYSIADDDLESKATLGLLEELFNIEIRGGGVASNLPVLTLGVGK